MKQIVTFAVSVFLSFCFVTDAGAQTKATEAAQRAQRAQSIATALAAVQQVKFTAAEQAEIDKFCAEFGSDVNARDEKRETLLHKAVDNKWSPAVVKFLISKGANLEAKDIVQFTPLHRAAGCKNTDRELGERNFGIVKILVYVGADVNARTGSGYTPLHLAASNTNVEVTKLLVYMGADVTALAGTNSKYIKKRAPDLAKEANNTAAVLYYTNREAETKVERERTVAAAKEAERAWIQAQAAGIVEEKRLQHELEMERARQPININRTTVIIP